MNCSIFLGAMKSTNIHKHRKNRYKCFYYFFKYIINYFLVFKYLRNNTANTVRGQFMYSLRWKCNAAPAPTIYGRHASLLKFGSRNSSNSSSSSDSSIFGM